ncbi:helix-turn-helix domain-containing protein [Neorhizobium alkalisoli]|uniref:AraC-like DNA-binding protein n=1 Tax=Neorhizobium alkalisoli TaxID=528178 RepID=A0A561R8B0_9HYPH|nr:AraC family transcriptional regulator [Neorhizobium alkalisoli]TWF58846.1 AraC-like DNA-binding protein [Neorhizobium alkalisoli]
MSNITRGGLAPLRLSRAVTLLEDSLTNRMTLLQVAGECGLSLSYFARAFKASTGLSPYQWLAQHRIDKAIQALESSMLPLSEIATLCGFADQAHFARAFRKAKGVTPSAWRRDARADEADESMIDLDRRPWKTA